jgi:hypothetical protein
MIACKFVISFLAWKCFHSYLKRKPNPGVRILVELNHANSKFINRLKENSSMRILAELNHANLKFEIHQ